MKSLRNGYLEVLVVTLTVFHSFSSKSWESPLIENKMQNSLVLKEQKLFPDTCLLECIFGEAKVTRSVSAVGHFLNEAR